MKIQEFKVKELLAKSREELIVDYKDTITTKMLTTSKEVEDMIVIPMTKLGFSTEVAINVAIIMTIAKVIAVQTDDYDGISDVIDIICQECQNNISRILMSAFEKITIM